MFVLVPPAIVALTVGVFGAQGGLGRELVQQCRDRGHIPVAYVRDATRDIRPPVRNGWLEETESPVPLPRPFANLDVRTTAQSVDGLDAVVFAMSGKPFVKDTSTVVVRDVCDRLPPRCTKMCLVSAWGVGDTIQHSNLGIKVMKGFYLHSTYSAKAIQETMVRTWSASLPLRENLIVRPKVLSFSPIPFNTIATPRQTLAATILDWIEP